MRRLSWKDLTLVFGARSKSEIDLLVFSGLIEAGLIDHSQC
jgi:hypothetical protein